MNPSTTDVKAVMGVDIGSITSKAVIFAHNAIVSWAIISSGGNTSTAAIEVINQVLSKAGLTDTDITYTIATGYGAANVLSANQSSSDISCHGRGISYLFPSVRTVVDVGGQFSRAFKIDRDGRLLTFVLSEKCAAGSGRLLQVIARVLQVDVHELGVLSLKSKNNVNFTTGCAVFNESEAISRIAEGTSKEDIAAGINQALAFKIQSLMDRIGIEPDYALAGGGAKNIGLVKNIENLLKVKLFIPDEPQIVAALGAALIAREIVNSKSI
jgi:(R)-2-hydroxyacyl-CoA dehydratese activating ATPase